MTFAEFLAVLGLVVGVAGVIIGFVLSQQYKQELAALKAERRVHTDQLHDLNESVKALQGIIKENAASQGRPAEDVAAETLHELAEQRSPSANSASSYTTSVGPFHPDVNIPEPEQADESRIARLLLGHTYLGDPERDPWLRKWRNELPTTWDRWQAKWDKEQASDKPRENVNLRSTGDDEVHE